MTAIKKNTCPYCGKTLRLMECDSGVFDIDKYSFRCDYCGFVSPWRNNKAACCKDIHSWRLRQLLSVIDDEAICIKLMTNDAETTIAVDAIKAFASDRVLNGVVTDVWVDKESDGIGVALNVDDETEEDETDAAGLL